MGGGASGEAIEGVIRGAGLGAVARVEPRGIRGQAHLVTLADGQCVFVKFQPLQGVDPAVRTRRERTAASLLADAVPAVLADDPGGGWLVSEAIGGEPMARRAGDLDLDFDLGWALGLLLARVHERTVEPDDGVPDAEPRIPEVGTVTPQQFADGVGFDYPALLAFLQADGVPDILAEMRTSWEPTTLVHADLRGDNVLRDEHGRLFLVDWELGGAGDPRADLGALIGMYLMAWLSSVEATDEGELADWLDLATVPLDSVRAPLTAALLAYAERRPLDVDAVGLAWPMRWAGVFLVRQAMSILNASGQLTQSAWCYLYAARRLLLAPSTGVQLLWPVGLS